jgi:hypothetical protein
MKRNKKETKQEKVTTEEAINQLSKLKVIYEDSSTIVALTPDSCLVVGRSIPDLITKIKNKVAIETGIERLTSEQSRLLKSYQDLAAAVVAMDVLVATPEDGVIVFSKDPEKLPEVSMRHMNLESAVRAILS